jgi:hypothetical protein
MTTGFDITKDVVDNALGVVTVQLRETFREIDRLAVWFTENNDAALLALGFTQPQIDLRRASLTALSKLSRVSRAADTVPVADDFFFNARKLTGLR